MFFKSNRNLKILGIINVRLLLLESTILFLTTEPILKSCQLPNSRQNWRKIINQVWLSLPITAIISIVFVQLWINVLSQVDMEFRSDYQTACYVIGLSCVIEQIAQIFLLLAQNYAFIRLKIVADSIHFSTRSVIFLISILANPTSVIQAFSLAQIVSIIIFFMTYAIFFGWYINSINLIKKEKKPLTNLFENMQDFDFDSICDFLPNLRSMNFDYNLLLLTVNFWKQSVFKQILTEGEKYVMTLSPIFTFKDQAIYDTVNNLGSLAARFLFRPIETNAYFYFTQLIDRNREISQQNSKQIAESMQVFRIICKLVLSLGCVIVVFGQSFSHMLLWFYGGAQLANSTAVHLLKLHCFAVLLLAVNGITECYSFATMNNQQLDRSNYLMIYFSFIFLFLSYIFVYIFGPSGLILANCVNMCLRIVHSLSYISQKFANSHLKPFEGFLLDCKFLTVLVMSGVILKLTEYCFYEVYFLVHLAIGILLFLLVLLIWYKNNTIFLNMLFPTFIKKNN